MPYKHLRLHAVGASRAVCASPGGRTTGRNAASKPGSGRNAPGLPIQNCASSVSRSRLAPSASRRSPLAGNRRWNSPRRSTRSRSATPTRRGARRCCVRRAAWSIISSRDRETPRHAAVARVDRSGAAHGAADCRAHPRRIRLLRKADEIIRRCMADIFVSYVRVDRARLRRSCGSRGAAGVAAPQPATSRNFAFHFSHG